MFTEYGLIDEDGVIRERNEDDNAFLKRAMKMLSEQKPTSEERLAALEEAMLALMMGGMPHV